MVHAHPAGAESDTNVVLAGVASDRVRLDAASGPLFVTEIV